MPIRNMSKFMRTLSNVIDTKSSKDLKALSIMTVQRAKIKHKYKNRTGNLTNQLKYRFVRRKKEISFLSMFYGKYIISGQAWKGRKKDDYINNAWKWSNRNYKKD